MKLAMLSKLAGEKDPKEMTREDLYAIKAGDIKEMRKELGAQDMSMFAKNKIREAELMRNYMKGRAKSKKMESLGLTIDNGITMAWGAFRNRNFSNALNQIGRITPYLMMGYHAGYVDAEVKVWAEAIDSSVSDSSALKAAEAVKAGDEITSADKEALRKAAEKKKKGG